MSAVASILSGVQPDNYLVWDIETGQPPEADIMQQIEGKLLPKISPSECEQLTATEMVKAGISDTKRKQLIEAGDLPEAEKNGRANVWPVKAVNAAIDHLNGQITADAMNKGALTSAAPIICVAFKGMLGTDRVMIGFHAMGAAIAMPELESMGWTIIGSDTEAEMLANISRVLDNSTDEGTELAGHNIIGFDLPKIRNRCVRSRVSIPMVFQPGSMAASQPVYDTMRKAKYFCVEAGNSPFFSFAALEIALGISNPGHKSIVSGADVPVLHAEAMAAKASGNTERWHELAKLIMAYNCQDAVQEEKAYRMMTGRREGINGE